MNHPYQPVCEDELVGVRQTMELLRGLTHELGNNLQIISGELDFLSLTGVLPQGESNNITHAVKNIRNLAHEIDEYLFPPALHLKTEDPVALLNEVVRSREKALADFGIQIAVLVKGTLPSVPLDSRFGKAIGQVIDFSRVLLPPGGELKIEAGVRRRRENEFVEMVFTNCSPTPLRVDEKDVFRPFLKVGDFRIGLSMAMVRQILHRHSGKIHFRKERRNRGVFSILIRALANFSG